MSNIFFGAYIFSIQRQDFVAIATLPTTAWSLVSGGCKIWCITVGFKCTLLNINIPINQPVFHGMSMNVRFKGFEP